MNLFKGITYFLGMALLILGSTQGIQDWDIGLSVLLATYTLLTAEWSVTALWGKEYKKYPIALISTLVVPYAIYVSYWTIQGKESVMIPGQLGLVTCLYLIMGIIWAFYRKHQQEIAAILPKMVANVRGQHR